MTDTTAKIRAKGLDATGVTEDIAAQMYHRKGAHYMAIVEMRVDETHDKADGQHKVDLVLTQVEPALDDQLSEHLRELTRTLHYNRSTDDDQPALTDSDGIEPSVTDVLSRGARFQPHPYVSAQLALDDEPVCDVCGQDETTRVHHAPAVDPFAVTSEDPDDENDDEAELDRDEEPVEEPVEEDNVHDLPTALR